MLEYITREETGILSDKLFLGQGVDFVGIISKQGRIIDCVCKNEINLPSEKKEMFFMGASLQTSMQREYDDELGSVKYVITERENSKIISIPIPSGSIVIIMKKGTRHFAFIKKIMERIRRAKNQSLDLERERSLEHLRY